MSLENKTNQRIHILREDVAQKIAAGEVIDRPLSVVRELLDNSIDAGAKNISLYLEEGGITGIRVIDDGQGMCAEDMRLCFLPHATSKIIEENDIYHTKTLGFRGEALASIAHCSKLDIVSALNSEQPGNKLIVREGKIISMGPCKAKKGTIVDVAELFYNMPARKKFLKRASGETTACKNIFMDKSLPFPDISFRLFIGNTLKLFLPAAALKERVAASYPDVINPSFLFEEKSHSNDFSITLVGCRPEVSRKERRFIHIFVNNRRITDFSLVQAVEYGYSGFMPGKDFPIAFVFIDVLPELVDFNIHPAKKECKFLNLGAIHHNLVALIQGVLNRFSISIPRSDEMDAPVQNPIANFPYSIPRSFNKQEIGQASVPYQVYKTNKSVEPFIGAMKSFNAQRDLEQSIEREPSGSSIEYKGQIFNLFLLAEYNGELYIIDQHAAHERILFDRLKASPSQAEDLMFPISFETEEDEALLLENQIEQLARMSIHLVKTGHNRFEITSLSPDFKTIKEQEFIDFLKNKRGIKENLQKELYSMIACKQAIKDGETLDPVTALNLIKETFKLENPRCPHGRPIWYSISREDLFRLMGRK